MDGRRSGAPPAANGTLEVHLSGAPSGSRRALPRRGRVRRASHGRRAERFTTRPAEASPDG